MSQSEVPESIVAYLDVLGFKRWIWSHVGKDGEPSIDEFEGLGRSLSQALDQAIGNTEDAFTRVTQAGRRITAFQFSDSLVLATECGAAVELPVVKGLVAFAGVLLQRGLSCRAGVARGYVYRDDRDGHLFGPGYLKAYTLESKVAFYPRIALEEAVATALLETLNGDPLAVERNGAGQAFVNLFADCYSFWDEKALSRASRAIDDQLSSLAGRSDKLDVAAKWDWLRASWAKNNLGD